MRLLLVAVFSILMLGCTGDTSESVEDFVARTRQNKSNKIAQLPKVKEYNSFEYGAYNLNDPFRPISNLIIEEPLHEEELLNDEQYTSFVQQPRPDSARTRELLENYPIDSLEMVGTLTKQNNTWGLILDKNGIIHRVKKGNYVGENSGKIEEITTDTIFIKELVADGQGGWIDREAYINMQNN